MQTTASYAAPDSVEGFCQQSKTYSPAVRSRVRCIGLFLGLFSFCSVSAAGQQRAVLTNTTETSLQVGQGESARTTAPGTIVTLTANVRSGGSPVAAGLVLFCDADALYCEDAAVLGKAQINANGSAVLRLNSAAIGVHRNVKAVFAGTRTHAGSTSGVIPLTVPDPPYPSAVNLIFSGTPAAYKLSATVSGGAFFDASIPTGDVTFVDATTSTPLGTVNLDSGKHVVTYFPQGMVGTTASKPVSMVVADFDNDGLPDIATANIGAGNLSVLIADGFGGFNSAPTPSTNSFEPTSIATADFNGDGNADLVVTGVSGSPGTPGITALMGAGDGTFVGVVTAITAAGPRAVATGDFNGDGRPDVAVACAQKISILLNDGFGGFNDALTAANVFGAESLVVADFNGDHIDDIAVGAAATKTVVILLGNGDGTFTQVQSLGTFDGPSSMVAGDFNNDGKTDLTVININARTAVTLLNNGAGIFHLSSLWHTGVAPTGVLAADLNLDGNLDLAIPISGWNKVMLLYGVGNGRFHLGGYLTTSSRPSAIGFGAFLGPSTYDPFPAIVVADEGTSTIEEWQTSYFGQASATLAKVSEFGTGTYSVVAKYSGGGDWAPASSPPVTLTSYLHSATTVSLSAASVPAGTPVTLIGKVIANGSPVTSGVVRFCDAAAVTCTGSLWYGTTPLNSSGVATLTRVFAAGTYHIDGRFPATAKDAKSRSTPVTLTVTP